MANTVNESAIKKLKLVITVVDRPKAEFYLDILSQFEKAVIAAALNPADSDIDSNAIDVEVEAVDKNGDVLLKVWLTSFNGYEEDKWAGSHTDVWLDDMFDLTESPFDANDYNNMR